MRDNGVGDGSVTVVMSIRGGT